MNLRPNNEIGLPDRSTEEPEQMNLACDSKIIKAVGDLSHIARRSITFDHGTEFVSWPHLRAEIGKHMVL